MHQTFEYVDSELQHDRDILVALGWTAISFAPSSHLHFSSPRNLMNGSAIYFRTCIDQIQKDVIVASTTVRSFYESLQEAGLRFQGPTRCTFLSQGKRTRFLGVLNCLSWKVNFIRN